MNKITIIIFIFIIFCFSSIYANSNIDMDLDIITEGFATDPFFKFVGNSLDSLIYNIKKSLLPGIFTLTKVNDSSTISILPPSSIIGIIINILLVFECLFFGIKSFYSEDINMFFLVKKLIQIFTLLTFISSVNIIGEAILNIFITLGRIATGDDINNTSFYPSTILSTFSPIKNIIDATRIQLGKFSLPKIVDIFLLSLSSIIIAIPFLISSIMFIFYYLEYILIVLATTVILPLSFFEFTSLSSIKNVLRAILLQGIKIFIVVFFSSVLKNIITNEIENYNLGNVGVVNILIYLLLYSLIYLFGIIEGTKIISSVINGDMISSGVLKSGFLLSLPFTLLHSFKKKPKNTSDNKGYIKNISNTPNDKDKSETDDYIKENPTVVSTPITKTDNFIEKSKNKNSKYLTKATPVRINDAYNSFIKEGAKDVTTEEVKERARWDSTFNKLKNKKSENLTDDERKIFERMKKEKVGYINGTHTFRGDLCKKE